MFMTKHLLALVALAVGAAASCDVCSDELYDGKCGALSQEAEDKWDDWMVEGLEIAGCIEDVCCASNEDDCCEANVGAIVGIVIALVVVIGGSIFACCKYRQNDETYGVAVPPGKLENCRRIHAPMRDWYAAPAQRSLKAKHGNFPRDPEVLSAWSSYDAVVTAFLDSAPGRENDSV